MPRFYLDVLNGGEVLEDPDGQAFADVQAAIAEAAAMARDLVAHGLLRNEDLSYDLRLISSGWLAWATNGSLSRG